MSNLAIRQALENGLNAMAGIIPSVAITSSATGTTAVFTTAVPHLLNDVNGNQLPSIQGTISGHSGSTPSLNGSYTIIPTGASTFSLQNRVTGAVIASTVGGTGGTLALNLTAWENIGFAPIPMLPWQRVNFIFATPENPTYSGANIHTREQGYMQVNLYYPVQKGTVAVMTRAELIRSTFPRGSSFVKSGVTVHIPRTPEILQGIVQNESYIVPVKVHYWADIFT